MAKLQQSIFLFALISVVLGQLTFDLTQQNKYGTGTIKDSYCNKDTQIDLFFSENSWLNCNSTPCTSSNLGDSSLKFLDFNGNDLTLTLNSVEVNSLTLTGFPVSAFEAVVFTFATDGNSSTVKVVVPTTTTTIDNAEILDISNAGSSILSNLNSLGTQNNRLSWFTYLNEADYSRFYAVANADNSQTLLVNTRVLNISSAPPTSGTTDFTKSYSTSGDKLCFGSNIVGGQFQTHLRESWPLWTFIISLFIYWLFYLLSEAETDECENKKYEENKWTCWSMYSLFKLAHPEYFTRLSRVSNVYWAFSLQAVVLAALYSTLGDNNAPYTHYEIIIWTAAIAVAASFPLPFITGAIFLTPIYKNTLKKFQITKKTKGTLMNKSEEVEIYKAEIDQLEEKLYSYYYWFYILFAASIICFWIPAIYMMMQTQRDWYYLHRIWLASLMIAFVLDTLIIEPLLTKILGNTKFYRIRGYFYNFALGQEWNEIEE